MLDEILDVFDRDGRRDRPQGERRGLRGLLSRMFSGDEDGDDTRRSRYEDDDPRRTRRDEDDDSYAGRRRRERENDAFDFGD